MMRDPKAGRLCDASSALGLRRIGLVVFARVAGERATLCALCGCCIESSSAHDAAPCVPGASVLIEADVGGGGRGGWGGWGAQPQ
eukprot:4149411-Pyramimonas_sp.AAC.1